MSKSRWLLLLTVFSLMAAGSLRPAWGDDRNLLKTAALFTCESASVDVGEKKWRKSLLLEGFYRDERQERSFAWTQQEASVRLLLAEGGDRRLQMVARAAAENLQVTAKWNGVELGTRSVPRKWARTTWDLPAHLARAGANRLELQSSAEVQAPSGRRRLALAIDRLEILPSNCDSGPAQVTFLKSGEPLDLPAGALFLSSHLRPPSPRLKIAAEGFPGATLEVFAYASDEQNHLGTVTIGRYGRVEETFQAGPCCQEDSGLVLLVPGPEPVRLNSLRLGGDDRPQALRRAYSLLGKELLLAIVSTALALALAHLLLQKAPNRWAPWFDVVLVIVLALVLRLIFLQYYPDPGRSADAYEYLLRARWLTDGRATFLTDTGWHGWQTWTRPPGYYLFLAGILETFEGEIRAALQLQAAFSACAAGATYFIAYALFGRRAAVAAGLISALYIESIISFSRVLSEPLYMLFLIPALAALSWVASRPSWRVAALAGALFGLAALVRSAPIFYVPLAAALLLLIHGLRPAWRASMALIGAMVLVVLPWCVRNSMIAGTVTGIDDLAVINLLQVSPDDRFVQVRDLDLDTPEGARTYYSRLQKANHDRALSSQAGTILKANLEQKLAHPLATLSKFGANLTSYFALDDHSFRRIHREQHPARVLFVTDLMNLQYLFVLALGVVGLVMTIRDRRTWPLVLWFFFNMVLINFFFHPETKYRFPTFPVVMVLAGMALERALGAIGQKFAKQKGSSPTDDP